MEVLWYKELLNIYGIRIFSVVLEFVCNDYISFVGWVIRILEKIIELVGVDVKVG